MVGIRLIPLFLSDSHDQLWIDRITNSLPPCVGNAQ